MAEHAAATPTAPRRAAIRTAIQVGIPAFVSLLGILPLIIQAIVDGFGQHLPPALYSWLLAAAVVITAASATIARIMAIPAVIAWTRANLAWLAPAPVPPAGGTDD